MGGECSTHGGEERFIRLFFVRKHGEKDRLEDAAIDGRIIIRLIFRKWDGGHVTGSIWLRIGTGGGHL
jgi:hypothetical protein